MKSTTRASALSPRATSSSPPPCSTRSGPGPRTGSPPWTQIVRGMESDPNGGGGQQSQPLIGDQINPTAPENSSHNNEKQAWNKKQLLNTSIESGGGSGGGGGGGGVLTAEELWPPLSESTKMLSKLSPSASSKNLSDFVPPIMPQGIGKTSSPSVSQPQSPSSSLLPSIHLHSPLQSTVSSPKSNPNSNHNPNPNHGRTTRQKSMKRDGMGNNTVSNGGFSHQSSTGESSHNHNSNVKSGYTRPNSFRSNQNYGGRRGDSDRVTHDWNHQGSFNSRDGPIQTRVSPRSYVRGPPISASFVQPFINPMGIPDVPVVYFSPTVPFGPPLSAPMYFVAPDPQLKARIVNQIDYYFSNENLIKDTYLRQNMDEDGWVSLVLIAGFKKVKQLTENIQLILEAVQSSSVVEAQLDKIRKRGDWKRWIMPSTMKFQNAQDNITATSLCADIQSVRLDEKATCGTSSVGC